MLLRAALKCTQTRATTLLRLAIRRSDTSRAQHHIGLRAQYQKYALRAATTPQRIYEHTLT
eukprot:5324113-Lingulodinium_polyedra.AAC.1